MSRSTRLAAFVLGMTALPLFGCTKPTDEAQAAPPPATPAAPANVKRIDIAVEDGGFSPSSIDVKKGEPVVLRFTRTTKSECLKAIAIPDLSIKQELPMNTPVEVAITPQKEGKMVLQCWMAMVKATINVVGS